MLTNLNKQLNVLKIKENENQRKIRDNERPSILFTFKEAASISEQKISTLALEGYKNFSIYNPEITKFYDVLFNPDNEIFDREKLTEIENEKLSESLKKIMIILSQNLKNSNVMKILELLIRKFEVHKYEPEQLIIYYLHYHTSPIYIKILQNINLYKKDKWFQNFEYFVKKGEIIKRKALYKKILKHSFHILDLLADYNISYLKEKSQKVSLSNNKNYYFNSKDKNVDENEPISFRFFFVILIEFMENNKNNMNLKLHIKKIFYRVFGFMVNYEKLAFFDGCIFMANFFIYNNFLTNLEITAILKDLFNLIKKFKIKKDLVVKFLFFISKKSYFEYSNEIIYMINEDILLEIEKVSKYYSIVDLSKKILHLNLENLFKNEINKKVLLNSDRLLNILFTKDHYLKNSNLQKNYFFRKLSEFFILVCKKDFISDRILSSLFKNIKLYLEENVQLFIKQLYNVYNNEIQNSDNIDKTKIKIRFKKYIKSIFGNISFYGLLEEEDMKNNKYIVISSLLNLKGEKKLKFLKNLLKNFHSIKSKENKNLLKKLIYDSIIEENNIELVIEIFPIIKNIGFENEIILTIKKYIINNIIEKKIILNQTLIKLIKKEFVLSISKNPFFKVFDILILINQEKNSPSIILNNINTNIKYFFELKYENLLIMLNYASIYNDKKNIVFNIIKRMIDSSIKMKITKNSIENFIVVIKKSLKLLFLLKKLGYEEFKEKSNFICEKIFTEILKNMKKIENSFLWEITTEVLSFLFTNKSLDDISLNENFIFFILTNFINLELKNLSIDILNSINHVISNNLDKITNIKKLYDYQVNLIFNILNFFIKNNVDFKKENEYLCVLKKIGYFLTNNCKDNENIIFLEILTKTILESSQELSIENKDIFNKKFKKLLTKILKDDKLKINFSNVVEQIISTFDNENNMNNKKNSKNLFSLVYFLKELDYDFSQIYFEKIKDRILNQREKIENYIFLDIIYIFLQFYLKSGDLINYLNLFNVVYKEINPQKFLKVINNYLHTSSVFIKIITVYKIWKNLEIYELKDMNLNLNEIIILFFIIVNDEHIDRENVKNFLVFFKMEISKHLLDNKKIELDNIIDLFCLLKILMEKIIKKEDKHKNEFFYLLNLVCEFLNTKNKKFFNNPKVNQNLYQNDNRNLNLTTIYNQLNIKNKSMINDFAVIQKDIILIDMNQFLNKKNIEKINTIMDNNLKSFLNYNNKKEDENNGMEIEETNNNEYINEIKNNSNLINPYIKKIKSLNSYFMLFIKLNPKDCFNIVRGFLSKAKDYVLEYKKNIITNSKNNKIKLENILDIYENIEMENNEHVIRIKSLDTSLIYLYLENLKLIKKFLKRKLNKFIILISLDFFKLLDNSIYGGLEKVLNSKKNNQKNEIVYLEFNKILNNLLKDIFKGDIKTLIFILTNYFLTYMSNKDFNIYINYLKEFVKNYYFVYKEENECSYSLYIIDILLYIQSIINVILFNNKKNEFFSTYTKDIIFFKKFINLKDLNISKKKFLIIYSSLNINIISDIYLKKDLKFISSSLKNLENDEIKDKLSLLYVYFFINSEFVSSKNYELSKKNEKVKYFLIIEKLMESFNNLKIKILPINMYIVIIPKILKLTDGKDSFNKVLSNYLKIINQKLMISQIKKTDQNNFINIYNILFDKLLTSKTINYSKKNSDRLLDNFINLSSNLYNKLHTLYVKNIQNYNKYKSLLNVLKNNTNPYVKINGFLFFAKLSENLDTNFLRIFNNLFKSFIDFFVKSLFSLNFSDKNKLENFIDKKNLLDMNLTFEKNPLEFMQKLLLFIEETFKSAKNFLEPYIGNILILLSQIPEKYKTIVLNTVRIITNSIDPRITFSHINTLLKKIEKNNLQNIFELLSHFCIIVISNLDQNTFTEKNNEIFNIILNALTLTEKCYVKNNIIEGILKENWIDSIKIFALKCNKTQLKNYFSLLKKWILDKNSSFPIFRKSVIISIQNKIIEKLGNLGIFLYNETFDIVIEFMNSIKIEKLKNKKRTNLNEKNENIIYLHSNVSKYIILLCENENNDFINIFKFEQLAKCLLHQIENFRFFEKNDLLNYFEKNILICFEKLTMIKKEDYQMKDIMNTLFNNFHNPDSLIRLLSIKVLISLVKGLQEGSILFLNDIIPKLTYVLDDEIQEVSIECKVLIDLMQTFSNENIQEFIINGVPNFEA